MRSLAVLFFSTLGTTLLAQSPLTTLAVGGNQGNVGGGIYFDLTVNTTVTFNQIDFRIGDEATGAGVLEIYLGPTTYLGNVMDPSLWTLVATTQTVTPIVTTTVSAPLQTPFALGPGQYGVALRAGATFDHGYTNGTGCTSTTIPGSCTNSVFSNAELMIQAGAAQNAFLTGGVFTPRVWNGALHYTLGGTPIAVGAQEQYGDGCYGFYTSYYEFFPNPGSIDVANSSILHTFNGTTYDVGSGATPYTPPTATPVVLVSGNSSFLATAALGGPLPFPVLRPDGAGGVVVANDLEIYTDGYIVPLASSTPTGIADDPTPTVNEFLNAPTMRWAPHWKNMDPASLGNMTVEVEATTGALVVSWNMVADPNLTTTTSTFQVAFYPNSNVEYRYQNMSVAGGGSFPMLIGLTHGNGALDRQRDLSLAVPAGFSTQATDNTPLDLILSARPVLGTNPNFVVSGYDAATTVGARILSFTQFDPGISLAPLGMPGCFQFVGLDSTAVVFLSPGQTTFPFIAGGIPNNPVFNGVLIFGQAASFTSGFNPLGVITSNGLRMTLGSL